MSLEAMALVWRESKAKGGDLLVMLAIANYTNDRSWWAWPSTDTLADKSRMTRRNCIRVLQRLQDDLGEILIDQNSGPNGVNRYQILLGTKGKITNPTAESDKKKGGDKLSGVTNCQGDISGPKMSHKRLGTTHTNGEGSDCVEWPSKEEVLKAAAEYPGNMAKGIPATIPEAWARSYWHWRTHEKREWQPDWRAAMVSRFENEWQDGLPSARGVVRKVFSWQGGGFQKKNAARERGEILQELQTEKNAARRKSLQLELEAAT